MVKPIGEGNQDNDAMIELMIKVCSLDPDNQMTKNLASLSEQVCENHGYRPCLNLMWHFLKSGCRIKMPLTVFHNFPDTQVSKENSTPWLWFHTGQKILKDTVPEGSLDTQSLKVDKAFYYTPVIHTRDHPNLAQNEDKVQQALGDQMMITETSEKAQSIIINDGLLERAKGILGSLFYVALQASYFHEYIHTIEQVTTEVYEAEKGYPYYVIPFFKQEEINAYAMQVLFLKEKGVSDENIRKIMHPISAKYDKIPIELQQGVNFLISDFADIISGPDGVKRFQRKIMQFTVGAIEQKSLTVRDPEDARLLTALKAILAKTK